LQPRQARQDAGRAAVDPLPFLLGTCIEQKVLPIGKHTLCGQATLGEQERTAVGAEGGSSPIQQVTVALCGPQLDPTRFGRTAAGRLYGGQSNKPKNVRTLYGEQLQMALQPPKSIRPSQARFLRSARHWWIAGITSSSSRVDLTSVSRELLYHYRLFSAHKGWLSGTQRSAQHNLCFVARASLWPWWWSSCVLVSPAKSWNRTSPS
jgi:hypothetical protein